MRRLWFGLMVAAVLIGAVTLFEQRLNAQSVGGGCACVNGNCGTAGPNGPTGPTGPQGTFGPGVNTFIPIVSFTTTSLSLDSQITASVLPGNALPPSSVVGDAGFKIEWVSAVVSVAGSVNPNWDQLVMLNDAGLPLCQVMMPCNYGPAGTATASPITDGGCLFGANMWFQAQLTGNDGGVGAMCSGSQGATISGFQLWACQGPTCP